MHKNRLENILKIYRDNRINIKNIYLKPLIKTQNLDLSFSIPSILAYGYQFSLHNVDCSSTSSTYSCDLYV